MSRKESTASPSASRGEEVLGKAYDSRLMLRLWTFVRPHRVLLVFAMLLMPLTVMFEIAQPYLLSIAIDVYIAHQVTDGLGLLALVFVSKRRGMRKTAHRRLGDSRGLSGSPASRSSGSGGRICSMAPVWVR